MSDDSDEEFSSLYKSIKTKNIPNVKDRKNEKSFSILENSSVKNATASGMHSDPQQINSNDSSVLLGISNSRKYSHSNKPFLKPKPQIKGYTRSQVLSFANAFSSDDDTSQKSHASQTDSSENVESHKLLRSNVQPSSTIHGQSWISKVKRKRAKQPANIESLLKPAAQSHSTEIIGSDPSSDDSEFIVPQNKFLKKKFKKSNIIHENNKSILTENNVNDIRALKSLSLEDNQHETHGKPESEIEDSEIEDTEQNKMKSIYEFHSKPSQPNKSSYFRELKEKLRHNSNLRGNNYESADLRSNIKIIDHSLSTQHSKTNYDKMYSSTTNPHSMIVNVNSENIFEMESSSSELTFDSNAVFHSTLRGSPISKSANNLIKDKRNFSTKLKNDGSTYSKVMAASTQHKENPVRNKEKHSSDTLTTEKRTSHNYQYVDALKDLSRVENQSESDKVYTFNSSESKHMSQHKEDRSNQHIIHSQQLVVSNNNEAVLSNVLRSTQKSKEIENRDKTDINLSSDTRTSSRRKLGNSKIALSLAPETKRNVIEIANGVKIDINLSSDKQTSSQRNLGNSKIALSLAPETKSNVIEIANGDKIDINLSSDKQTSSQRKLGNSKITLSLAPETKRNVIEIAKSDKIAASTSSDSDPLNQGITNNDKIAGSKSNDSDENIYVNSESESELFNFKKFKQNSPPRFPVNKSRSQRSKRISHISEGDPSIQTHKTNKKNDAPRRCRIKGNNLSLKQPAPWVNNRFYNKLMPFFENKFGPLKCYSICESRAVDIHDNVKKALKNPKHQEICVNNVRKILYDVGVIKTPMDFMLFSADYLPNEFNVIAIPKRMGICSIGVPYPKGIGLYDDFNL